MEALSRKRAWLWLVFAGWIGLAWSGTAWYSARERRLPFPEPARISETIARWSLDETESRFHRIGWTPVLHEAQARARRSGMPVFVLTSGGDIDQGRC